MRSKPFPAAMRTHSSRPPPAGRCRSCAAGYPASWRCCRIEPPAHTGRRQISEIPPPIRQGWRAGPRSVARRIRPACESAPVMAMVVSVFPVPIRVSHFHRESAARAGFDWKCSFAPPPLRIAGLGLGMLRLRGQHL